MLYILKHRVFSVFRILMYKQGLKCKSYTILPILKYFKDIFYSIVV